MKSDAMLQKCQITSLTKKDGVINLITISINLNMEKSNRSWPQNLVICALGEHWSTSRDTHKEVEIWEETSQFKIGFNW